MLLILARTANSNSRLAPNRIIGSADASSSFLRVEDRIAKKSRMEKHHLGDEGNKWSSFSI